MPDFPAWNLFSHFFPPYSDFPFFPHIFTRARRRENFLHESGGERGIEIWNSDFLSFSFFSGEMAGRRRLRKKKPFFSLGSRLPLHMKYSPFFLRGKERAEMGSTRIL